jgi:hypothetical protein
LRPDLEIFDFQGAQHAALGQKDLGGSSDELCFSEKQEEIQKLIRPFSGKHGLIIFSTNLSAVYRCYEWNL